MPHFSAYPYNTPEGPIARREQVMAYPPREPRASQALSSAFRGLCRRACGTPLLAGKGDPFPDPIPSLGAHR